MEPGDAWYYDRIAVQEEPAAEEAEAEASWLDAWRPSVQRRNRRIRELRERLRDLPRPRFELQGDRSNKFALFRCLRPAERYVLEWRTEESVPVDALYLLPTRIPQADGTVRQFGFPRSWRVEVSASGDFASDGRIVKEVTGGGGRDDFGDRGEVASGTDGLFPVPVAFPPDVGAVRAWRLVVEEPFSPFDIGYVALSEIFVISPDDRNVARRGELSWSDELLPDRTMSPGFLTDGQTPLGLPLVREATERLGYHSEITELAEGKEEWVELAWERTRELAAIRLIPAQQRVLPHTETFGFPRGHRTEAWRDGEKVVTRRDRYAVDPGQNLVVIRLGENGERVDRVRWTARELWQRRESGLLALAEIEAIDVEGENVAPEARVSVRSTIERPEVWSREALTDGLASEGRLLEAGAWLRGLVEARGVRREMRRLGEERRAVVARTERALLGVLVVLPVGVAGALGWLWWRDRRRLRRETEEYAARLAADLHDDLGGNLGSIVLLADEVRSDRQGEVAEGEGRSSPELDRVVELARESRRRLREVLRVGQREEPAIADAGALAERLEGMTRDFLGDLDHGVEVEATARELLDDLSDRQRLDLWFFCKEALHNLRSHGSPGSVDLRLFADAERLVVTVVDDAGEPAGRNGKPLSRSLRRRARQLRAKLVYAREEGRNRLELRLAAPARTTSDSSSATS